MNKNYTHQVARMDIRHAQHVGKVLISETEHFLALLGVFLTCFSIRHACKVCACLHIFLGGRIGISCCYPALKGGDVCTSARKLLSSRDASKVHERATSVSKIAAGTAENRAANT